MKFEYERLVDAPEEALWAALTEPAAMEQHLPGGTRVTAAGSEKLRVSMKIPMGFLRPTVNVDIRLSNVSLNDSFEFDFEGKAMGAGIAGTAAMTVVPDAALTGSTRVRLTGTVQTSGPLKKISDSKIEVASAGFLDNYLASVERSARQN